MSMLEGVANTDGVRPSLRVDLNRRRCLERAVAVATKSNQKPRIIAKIHVHAGLYDVARRNGRLGNQGDIGIGR